MIRIIVWKLHSIKNKNDSYDCFISNLAKNKELPKLQLINVKILDYVNLN